MNIIGLRKRISKVYNLLNQNRGWIMYNRHSKINSHSNSSKHLKKKNRNEDIY